MVARLGSLPKSRNTAPVCRAVHFSGSPAEAILETRWVGWKDAVLLVRKAEICSRNGEAAALTEWGAHGIVTARARLAIIDGTPDRDYTIPEQIWEYAVKGQCSVDRNTGEIRCERLPGPLVSSRSKRFVGQGIEFLAERLMPLLPDVIEAPPPAIAKKPHPSSLVAKDAPLIEEMRQLIASGEASGPYNAALAVADRAEGGGSIESKVRRLERRFNGE